MESGRPQPRGGAFLRGILAVVGGFVASGVTGTLLGMAKGRFLDPIISSVAPRQPMNGIQFMADLVLYAAMGFVGGTVAGRIARVRALQAGLVLAGIFLLLGANDQRHALPMALRLQTALDSIVSCLCCIAAARFTSPAVSQT